MALEDDFLWKLDFQQHWPAQSVLVVPYRTTEEAQTTLSLDAMREQIFDKFWGFAEGRPASPAVGSMAHYFRTVSNNAMAFDDPEGTYVTRKDYYVSNQRADYDLDPGDDLSSAMRTVLLRSLEDEVDFNAYTEGSGGVERGDLVVVMVNRSGRGRGGTVRASIPGELTLDGVKVRVHVAAFGNSADMDVGAHELIHVLVTQNTDLYGPGGWNTPASLMGNSPGRGVVHPDGVHKVRLGWQKPRAIDIASAASQTQTLLAQTVPERTRGEGDPIVLFDSRRSDREFFLLEYRTPDARSASAGDYESNLDSSGLAIWHAESDGNGYVRRHGYIKNVAAPGREPSGNDLLQGGGWLEFRPALQGNDGVFYCIKTDGSMVWYRNTGWESGTASWANGGREKRIASGRGWEDFYQVLAGNSGVLYCVKTDGSMVWYRNTGWETGDATWANGGREKRIASGRGWEDFHQLIASDQGVFYCIKTDGSMVWYRNIGWETGEATWANGGREKKIASGRGWEDFHQVVAGNNGVLYCIKTDGSMVWYRNTGWETGEATWANRGREMDIGQQSGWNDFHQVIAGDNGVFYCITKDGAMVWFRHIDWETGGPRWANGGRPVTLISGNRKMLINWGYDAQLQTRPVPGETRRHGPPINLVASPKGEYGYQHGFWTSKNRNIRLRWPGGDRLDATIRVAQAAEDADSIEVTITTAN